MWIPGALLRLADRRAGRRELAELMAELLITPECGWCGDPFDPDASGDPDYCQPEHRAADDAADAAWDAEHGD